MAGRTLTTVARLIDESHYTVSVRECPSCSQHFLTVFTESVDWSDGDDPQYWTRLPITKVEAEDLLRAGESVTEATINALGRNRRCLQYDHPKGKPTRISWGAAFFVGPHD